MVLILLEHLVTITIINLEIGYNSVAIKLSLERENLNFDSGLKSISFHFVSRLIEKGWLPKSQTYTANFRHHAFIQLLGLRC